MLTLQNRALKIQIAQSEAQNSMQAAQIKDLNQQIARFRASALVVGLVSGVNEMNQVNGGERYKSITFTTYPHESKGLVNVVNVARKYFEPGARGMPNVSARKERGSADQNPKNTQTEFGFI